MILNIDSYMSILAHNCAGGGYFKFISNQSINQSINQRFWKWPKWYATARTTNGNKTVGTEMSQVCDGMLSEFRPRWHNPVGCSILVDRRH